MLLVTCESDYILLDTHAQYHLCRPLDIQNITRRLNTQLVALLFILTLQDITKLIKLCNN